MPTINWNAREPTYGGYKLDRWKREGKTCRKGGKDKKTIVGTGRVKVSLPGEGEKEPVLQRAITEGKANTQDQNTVLREEQGLKNRWTGEAVRYAWEWQPKRKRKLSGGRAHWLVSRNAGMKLEKVC